MVGRELDRLEELSRYSGTGHPQWLGYTNSCSTQERRNLSHLWGLPINHQPSSSCWPIPATPSRWSLCHPQRGYHIHQAGPVSSVSTTSTWWQISQVHHHQYPPGFVPVPETSIWNSICASPIPKVDGHRTTRNTGGHLLHRWHPNKFPPWVSSHGNIGVSTDSPPKAWIQTPEVQVLIHDAVCRVLTTHSKCCRCTSHSRETRCNSSGPSTHQSHRALFLFRAGKLLWQVYFKSVNDLTSS